LLAGREGEAVAVVGNDREVVALDEHRDLDQLDGPGCAVADVANNDRLFEARETTRRP
jgi:hypothetical protein